MGIPVNPLGIVLNQVSVVAILVRPSGTVFGQESVVSITVGVTGTADDALSVGVTETVGVAAGIAVDGACFALTLYFPWFRRA